MKELLTILIFLNFVTVVYATEQESDLLIIDNDTVYLQFFPLDSLNLTMKPFGHTRETAPATGCWRGYRAIWRIIDNTLYLEKITRCYSDREEGEEKIIELLQLNDIEFQEKDGMILANWVTEDLYTRDLSKAKYHPDRLYLYEQYYGKSKLKKDNLRFSIVNGIITIDKLNKMEALPR